MANGYTVATGKDSYCWLKLDEESLVKTDQNSKLQFGSAKSSKLSISVLSGAITVETAPQKPGDAVEVRAGNSALAVRGTSFVVENHPRDRAVITMLTGGGSGGGGGGASTAAQDNTDIAAAKTTIEGATYSALQSNALNAAMAKTAAETIVSGLPLHSVTATVTGGTFTAARSTANGSHTFTVTLKKGAGTQQTTAQRTLGITFEGAAMFNGVIVPGTLTAALNAAGSAGGGTVNLVCDASLSGTTAIPANVTLDVNQGIALTIDEYTTLSPTGRIINNGTITTDGISNVALDTNGGTITNNGIITTTGNISLYNSANGAITNSSSGTINLKGADSSNISGTVTNSGIIRIYSIGDSQLINSGTFNNNGQIIFNGVQTITNSGTFNSTGTITGVSGAKIVVTGSSTVMGYSSADSPLAWNGSGWGYAVAVISNSGTIGRAYASVAEAIAAANVDIYYKTVHLLQNASITSTITITGGVELVVQSGVMFDISSNCTIDGTLDASNEPITIGSCTITVRNGGTLTGIAFDGTTGSTIVIEGIGSSVYDYGGLIENTGITITLTWNGAGWSQTP